MVKACNAVPDALTLSKVKVFNARLAPAVALSPERSRLDKSVDIYGCKCDLGFDVLGFVLFGTVSVDLAGGCCLGAC